MALGACGGSESPPTNPRPSPAREVKPRPRPQPKLEASHCPTVSADCRSASGRVVYVEAVDPDGDGDAHFVLTGRHGVTFPGISVIDVAKAKRPHPLPRVGDLVSAAGPIAIGSHGQRQIEATDLHVARQSGP